MPQPQYPTTEKQAEDNAPQAGVRQVVIDKEKLDALNASVQASKLPDWVKQGFMVLAILLGVLGIVKVNDGTAPRSDVPAPVVNVPVNPNVLYPVDNSNHLVVIPGKASANLKPPVSGMVGEPLIFDSAGTVGVFNWHFNANQVTPEQLMVFEDQDGRLVVFPKVSCTLNVVLFAYNDSDHSHDVKFASVFVSAKPDGGGGGGGGTVVNPPNKPVIPVTPVGPLGPKPTFAAGKYDFASISYGLAVNIEPVHRVIAPKLGKAIADEVEAIAAEVAAGTPVTVTEAKTRIQSINREVLVAEHVPAWTDFLMQWKEKTDAMNKAKTLTSLDDYLELWSETSVGLQAVK